MLSIVTPAFNEASNLEALYARLVRFFERGGGDWEWIVVDDHSPDDTFIVIERLRLLVSRDYRAIFAPGTVVSRDYRAMSTPRMLVSRDYRAISTPGGWLVATIPYVLPSRT